MAKKNDLNNNPNSFSINKWLAFVLALIAFGGYIVGANGLINFEKLDLKFGEEVKAAERAVERLDSKIETNKTDITKLKVDIAVANSHLLDIKDKLNADDKHYSAFLKKIEDKKDF